MAEFKAEDRRVHSWSDWIRDKILPPLLVTFICVAGGGGLALYNKIDSLSVQIAQMQNVEARVVALENEITVVRSQMVGWDTLKRIEQSLSLLAATGQLDKGLAAVAGSIRSEVESRKEFSEYKNRK